MLTPAALERIYAPLCLSVGIATFFVLTNQNIPFANGGNCDPWYYFGHFFIADQFHVISGTRVMSRLPAVLVGYISSLLFKGVGADYANFLILLVASTAAVYDAARRLFGGRPALITAIFFATQPLNVGNFSVTYTAPAVTFSAIAVDLAVIAATAKQRTGQIAALLGAGFFWGSAIHAHLYSLSYNFIVGVYCLDWWCRPLSNFVRKTVQQWLLLLLGALAATAVFGLISMVFLNGNFLFFREQFEAIFTVLVSEYYKPHWYLVGGRGALLLVGATAAAAQAVWIWKRGKDAQTRAAMVALIPFVVLELAQFAYTVYGGITLQYDYYIVWLLVPLALVIASIATRAEKNPIFISCVVGVYLACSLAANFGRLDLAWQSPAGIPPSIKIAIILVPALLWSVVSPVTALAPILILLALMNATIRPEKIGLPVWEGGTDRAVYARLRAGMAYISSFRFASRPKFWLDAQGQRWETVALARGYDYCLVDTRLPQFLPTNDPTYNPYADQFSAGDYLVLAPRNADELAKALARLQARHLAFSEMGRSNIDYRGVDYLLVVGQLRQSLGMPDR